MAKVESSSAPPRVPEGEIVIRDVGRGDFERIVELNDAVVEHTSWAPASVALVERGISHAPSR